MKLYADINKANKILKWQPSYDFKKSLKEGRRVSWLKFKNIKEY